MRLQIYALIGVAGLALMVGAVKYIQHTERVKIDLERERENNQTLERINEAISDHRTPDGIRNSLRNLAQ